MRNITGPGGAPTSTSNHRHSYYIPAHWQGPIPLTQCPDCRMYLAAPDRHDCNPTTPTLNKDIFQ